LISENKVYDNARKKLEDAIIGYQQIKHYPGEYQCLRILQFIKTKLKERNSDH